MNNLRLASTKPDPVSLLKHKDLSEVIFKPKVRENIYLRTPSYRKRKSISLVGKTNSECY
jgi:NAD+--asparagine ADP-ribosyltransferase